GIEIVLAVSSSVDRKDVVDIINYINEKGIDVWLWLDADKVEEAIELIEEAVKAGVKGIVLRTKKLKLEDIKKIIDILNKYGVHLLIDTELEEEEIRAIVDLAGPERTTIGLKYDLGEKRERLIRTAVELGVRVLLTDVTDRAQAARGLALAGDRLELLLDVDRTALADLRATLALAAKNPKVGLYLRVSRVDLAARVRAVAAEVADPKRLAFVLDAKNAAEAKALIDALLEHHHHHH
uniref:De novo design protein -T09 n=1 Tax=synthetic construct TaxID=32630 RepID=UPI0034E05743